MKKFFEEFKAFALKGNMMDMAIGVIIGGAFSTLVTSLTDNLISPILGILGHAMPVLRSLPMARSCRPSSTS